MNTQGKTFKLFAALISLALMLVFIEAAFTVYAFIRYRTVSVQQIVIERSQNKYIADMGITMSDYEKGLFPHPYFAFVHNRRWGGAFINNIGLYYPRDMPFKRDPAYFTILVTGGSVASQFAGQWHPQFYLENILNGTYDFGGKTVRVISGADGAWKQPQQTILLAMYAQACDAVIDISGFNEHYKLMPGDGTSIDMPANNYYVVNPMIGGRGRIAASALENLSDRAARKFAFSRTLYFMNRGVTGLLRGYLVRDQNTGDEMKEFGISTYGMFTLPEDWSPEEKITYNLEMYKKYVRIMNAVCREFNLRNAFFIQPCPAIGKELTENEKRVVGDLGYKDTYQRMSDSLLSLAPEGIPIVSLLDVFNGLKEDLYADPIHCIRDGEENSPAYRIMAERIALELEEAWRLKRK
jgi:hypothetical protein